MRHKLIKRRILPALLAVALTALSIGPAAALPMNTPGFGGAYIPPGSNAEVVVAVIDTGVDYTHRDLANKMKTDSGTSFAAAHVSGMEAVRLYTTRAAAMSSAGDDVTYSGGNAMLLATAPAVTGIAVKTQPADLVYTEGELLDLDGLVVTLSYSSGSPIDVGYEDFSAMSIAADPSHETVMAAAHNGRPVTVSCNGKTANTNNLTVTAAPEEGADLAPATFDKANPADVRTQIQWWHNALSVTDVKKAGISVGAAVYGVSREDENRDFLTIRKEYLATQPTGPLVLTVEFDRGNSAGFTITIQDTTGANQPSWPVWPVGSVVSTPDRTQTAITLSWTPAQDDVAVTGYRIRVYRGDALIRTVECTATTYEFTGLSPGTEYRFDIQALDGDGEFSAILPHIVSTYPESTPGIVTLWLNTPRISINGSFYMDDTAEIELVSSETGWQPEVTVFYKEWNSGRTAVEDKTRRVTLTETSSGSKRYTGDFPLVEGICEITALEGEAPQGVLERTDINRKVAGRLKATVQAPGGLDPDQTLIFNNILAGSLVSVRNASGSGVFTSLITAPGEFSVEGLDEAADYALTHYGADSLVLFQQNLPPVKGGLETEFQYVLNSLSHVKVKVVDDRTGLPVKNVAVRSNLLTYLNGMQGTVYTVTGEDGRAAVTGPYLAKNLLRSAPLALTAAHYSNSSRVIDLYQDESITMDHLALGDNEIVIRLKKIPTVTLEGTVTDVTGAPIKNVYISMNQTIGINLAGAWAKTGDDGRYTMQVARIAGEVSFNGNGRVVKEQVNPVNGVNTLDVTLQPPEHANIDVILETMDWTGATSKMDLNWLLASRMKVLVRNITNGTDWLQYDGFSSYQIKGEPGDSIEIAADGYEIGYGRGLTSTALNANKYAEARLVLKQLGSVNANVTDRSGSNRPEQTRYMTIYDADSEYYVIHTASSIPYISYALPEGTYRAVFSWEDKRHAWLSGWEGDPDCLITESFRVESGKAVALGTKAVNYAGGGYFTHNRANSFTSSHSVTMPGTVVTLKASYDYDAVNPIDPGKLELVARIPRDASLVAGSAVSRVTWGSIGAAQPVIGGDSITLDLKQGIARGVTGSLTYQVRINDLVTYENIMTNAELRFAAGGISRSETIGAVTVSTRMITLNAPAEIAKDSLARSVRLNGLAPADKRVELFDGTIKIGEARAAANGVWSSEVSLPDRGMPIYHFITAKTTAEGKEHTAAAEVLVGLDKAVMTGFTMTQGYNTVAIDPRDGLAIFPFPVNPGQGDLSVSITFNNADRVGNVKISGCSTIRQGNSFFARIPYTIPEISVQYDEDKAQNEKILRFDHGIPPAYLVNAGAEFVNGTAADIRLEYGADGYIKAFNMPAVKLTALNESFTVSMKAETVSFDPAGAKNRTDLGNGLYGYDFSYEETADGKYVITAYLDRKLLEKPAGYQASRQTTLRAANAKLEVVKAVVEGVGDFDKLSGAFGDVSKTVKTAELSNLLETIRPNLQPHVADYYQSQLRAMAKDCIKGKTLSLIGDAAGEAANLVPLLGQVVAGVAGLISGKLLGDMFDNEFDSDYNRLMAMMRNEPGAREILKKREGREDYGDYWHNWTSVAQPHWIMDPSGFVYEAVEENRIEGVTATALYLPKEEASNAAAAEASGNWRVWDAGWYLQENPQRTDAEGRYAWDVPEGWWRVQFVKDGYLTAYSDALPVPPPQVDINIPMMRLNRPAVERTVWGNGGRYVDVYFNKYMDISAFGASNAVSLADTNSISVPGTVLSAVPLKTGANRLRLTRTVRFQPNAALIPGRQYTLTVNNAVADYAGFSMAGDYTETRTVPATALIASLTGADITVEPGKDITQVVLQTLTFTAVDPAAQSLLDRRTVFSSSNANVVRISDNGTISSLGEGRAQITATSVDDGSKTADFTVTVAYPPAPVSIAHMAVLDAGGRLLTDLSINRGDTYTINPVITPVNATNKRVLYTSDNASVAAVDQSGVIRAVSEGIAAITAKTEDQNIRQRIFVTVLPEQPAAGRGRGGSYTVPTAAEPVASVTGGEVAKGTEVTLSTATAGANIYYTLDGSIPTDRSTLYSEPIVIEKDTTLKAIAVKAGMANSGVMTVDYTVKKEAPVPRFALKFTDVKETDWFYAAVYFLAEKGIARGTSETEYAPHETVTRAEFITILCRAYGIEERSGENFTDAGNEWYTGFLAAARQLGIARGVGNDRFEPAREITREEMVVMLYNYFKSSGKVTGTEGVVSYTDKDGISGWALEAVAYAAAKGWIKGKGNNAFDPQGNATRAELAQLFYNLLKQ